ALSALPLVTAGFFSKDEILAGAMANGHINLMVAGRGRRVHDLAVHLPDDFHRIPR
ncbi:NADH:ubiquinone oxidoreductase subunit L, partial [Salmonella enterica subsp. enterica serovar Heidelberg str. N4403]